MTKLPITVVMLTLNEAHNLPGALDNVMPWAEQVCIVDSLSTDETVGIALERGATVVQRPFTNFGDQWNWALDNLPIETAWTLKLDPDERVTDDLLEEMRRIVGAPASDTVAYSMRRRLWFMGKPLHVYGWVLRLWRTGRCRFSEVLVNEHPVPDGPEGRLSGFLEHFDSPDLHHWYEKQNRYSTMEAIMRYRGDALAARPRLLGSALERRMFLKSAFWRLPFRYFALWCYLLFSKGAWRDGWVGRQWARLRVEIYRTRALKTREMETTGRVPDVPRAAAGEYDPRVLETPLQRALAASGDEGDLRRDGD